MIKKFLFSRHTHTHTPTVVKWPMTTKYTQPTLFLFLSFFFCLSFVTDNPPPPHSPTQTHTDRHTRRERHCLSLLALISLRFHRRRSSRLHSPKCCLFLLSVPSSLFIFYGPFKKTTKTTTMSTTTTTSTEVASCFSTRSFSDTHSLTNRHR